ncbi:hypothetical protein [Archangium violaceum]|uniref:Uncharacterized protein n=1 Tax=Archangium violaceum Cb vi76 TaxID=1406225 RepID=A0A084SX49_9BACT|nr:hypothetical protein [Archangium violaceum]KFA93034.1 hypothetical protein Q664_12210 [Archangium violaceum Cb vi76]
MSRWPLWAVLAPGEPARLESRALAIAMPDWDEEDGEQLPFEVIVGSGRYHAIVGTDPIDIGAEIQIAEALSLEGEEPVYSIERANDPWAVTAWRNGALDVLEDVDPDSLAESLGCPLPGRETASDSSASKPLRNAALVEGVQAAQARRVLEENAGEPLPPGRYCFADTPKGLLLSSATGGIGYADLTLSERFPHARVYGVVASPGLDAFFVNVLQGGECIGQFSHPRDDFPCFPVLDAVKGERSPERILAALGIPAEWFRNE